MFFQIDLSRLLLEPIPGRIVHDVPDPEDPLIEQLVDISGLHQGSPLKMLFDQAFDPY